jgi:hypothetical protein
MKTSLIILSSFATLAGAAVIFLGNLHLPYELLFTAFFSATFLLSVVRDYTRDLKPLTASSAPVLMPAMPVFIDARPAATHSVCRPATDRQTAFTRNVAA